MKSNTTSAMSTLLCSHKVKGKFSTTARRRQTLNFFSVIVSNTLRIDDDWHFPLPRIPKPRLGY